LRRQSFVLALTSPFLHIVACLQIFLQPLFAEFKPVRFGSFFGVENEALVKMFDMDRSLSGIPKNTPCERHHSGALG
jgi:hypothetical protein